MRAVTVPAEAPPRAAADRGATAVAWGYAFLAALTLAHFLLGLPIQYSESFGNMQKLSMPWRELIVGEFGQDAYLRPLLWGALKLVYDLSAGDYFTWYRGFHALQVVVLIALYVALVRPRTWRDAALLPLGLAVLIGLHTFAGTVREAFPINTFMTVLILCFSAAVVSLGRYRWWHDVAAAVLFIVAALTVESGLLVGVIVIGAALVGARGVSKGGVAVVAALFAGYFVLRFAILDVGSPGLIERSSGYGFGILEPSQLVERFGASPAWFYAYNVLTSAMSVLLAEPSGGVFGITRALLDGTLDAAAIVTVISSGGVAALVAAFLWRRRAALWSWRFERDDRLVLLFVMVLGANAAISYAYTKDVIMSPAGAFLAVAALVSGRHFMSALPAAPSATRAALVLAGLLVLGGAWANRVIETHAFLRAAAIVERNDWAYVESTLQEEQVVLSEPAAALMKTLQEDALVRHPPPPALLLPSIRLLGEE